MTGDFTPLIAAVAALLVVSTPALIIWLNARLTAKVEQVHTIVNSHQTEQIREIAALHAEIKTLREPGVRAGGGRAGDHNP